jgi:heptose-I-phosphate ethanolaminephosphotransferase
MTYFSDHGENMKHYHTASPFFFDMVHIPFFVYLSPDYRASHPGLMETLKSHEHRVFTNDLIFDTLSGILGAQTNFYHAAYDFSSPDYSITDDQAMTLAGKRHISEDPDFPK